MSVSIKTYSMRTNSKRRYFGSLNNTSTISNRKKSWVTITILIVISCIVAFDAFLLPERQKDHSRDKQDRRCLWTKVLQLKEQYGSGLLGLKVVMSTLKAKDARNGKGFRCVSKEN
ncbi:hypothetical protein CDAR_201641 [Caerostris darwini]|uniref:Uncharacterized protein n=1 Tax=Caerostris darwini TaxID=1538125 RepID=A0AAV4TB36_9ARAC|nr:hypothetical protein CDAR_201641 [Caerostris darwini]